MKWRWRKGKAMSSGIVETTIIEYLSSSPILCAAAVLSIEAMSIPEDEAWDWMRTLRRMSCSGYFDSSFR